MPNRFEFVFTPKHASWLNLVETFFSKVARTVLRGIRVASKDELRERLERYIDEFNAEPVVFKWTHAFGVLQRVGDLARRMECYFGNGLLGRACSTETLPCRAATTAPAPLSMGYLRLRMRHRPGVAAAFRTRRAGHRLHAVGRRACVPNSDDVCPQLG